MAVRAVGGAALLGAAFSTLGDSAAARTGQPRGIVGSWIARGMGARRPLVLPHVFAPNGIFVASDAPVIIPTSLEEDPNALLHQSLGVGEWAEVQPGEYAFSYVAGIYRPDGYAIGTRTISAIAVYDAERDRWWATPRLVQTDLAGTVVADRVSPPIEATRVQL